jgi:hypothetical protein
MIKGKRKAILLNEAERLVPGNNSKMEGVISKILSVAMGQGRGGVLSLMCKDVRMPYYGREDKANWNAISPNVQNLCSRLNSDEELIYVLGWARRIAKSLK